MMLLSQKPSEQIMTFFADLQHLANDGDEGHCGPITKIWSFFGEFRQIPIDVMP